MTYMRGQAKPDGRSVGWWISRSYPVFISVCGPEYTRLCRSVYDTLQFMTPFSLLTTSLLHREDNREEAFWNRSFYVEPSPAENTLASIYYLW